MDLALDHHLPSDGDRVVDLYSPRLRCHELSDALHANDSCSARAVFDDAIVRRSSCAITSRDIDAHMASPLQFIETCIEPALLSWTLRAPGY